MGPLKYSACIAIAAAFPLTAQAVTVSDGFNTTDFGSFIGGVVNGSDRFFFRFTADGDQVADFSIAATGSRDDLGDIRFGTTFGDESDDETTLDFDAATMALTIVDRDRDPTAATGFIDAVDIPDGDTLFFLVDGNGLIDANASFTLDAQGPAVTQVPVPASLLLLMSAFGGLVFVGRKRVSSAA